MTTRTSAHIASPRLWIPYDLKAEALDSLLDVRNNFNLSAVINLPVGFKFNPDPGRRAPASLTRHSSASTHRTTLTTGTTALSSAAHEVARNSMRQSSLANLDLRIVKDFTLKGVGHHLDLFMDVFNVTGTGNRNFGAEGVSLFGLPGSPVFTAGQPLFAPNVAHLGGPREIQFTARLVAF